MTRSLYETPLALKQALERRLKGASQSAADLQRRRQIVVFDRFLARLARMFGDSLTLKGGFALELRLARSRSTKDIDLRLCGSSSDLIDRLQAAGAWDLRDYMTFLVQPDRHMPTIQSEGMRYEGRRFRVECQIAGKLYGRPFGVDLAFADPLVDKPERISAPNTLDFAGIEPFFVQIYPVSVHIAEKVHACSLPRIRPNTRVKDLPDLALLASVGPIEADRLRFAIRTTFEFRGTHPPPLSLPPPPEFWGRPYEQMATEEALPWPTLSHLSEAVQSFLNPVLDRQALSVWSSDLWRWS